MVGHKTYHDPHMKSRTPLCPYLQNMFDVKIISLMTGDSKHFLVSLVLTKFNKWLVG